MLGIVLSCVLPAWLLITATDVCWTASQYVKSYNHADGQLVLSYWLMSCKQNCPESIAYKSLPIDQLPLKLIEHPDAFTIPELPDTKVLAVFRVMGLHTFTPYHVIEYSKNHEQAGMGVLTHEIRHGLVWHHSPDNPLAWSQGGHGTDEDVLLKSVLWLGRWFFWGLPPSHKYYPWQLKPVSVPGEQSITLCTLYEGASK